MSRLLAALAASLLLAASARAAQDDKKPADVKKPAEAELDAKTRAAIEREIEKAKEDIRNEVRAEIQGAQSAAEFLGAVAEGPKLEFLELDGYYRVRGQTLVNLDLTGRTDAGGFYLFPVPLQNPAAHDTLRTANMRLRIEPTLNVSEHVRVRAQIDVLDNYALGSSTSTLFDDPSSPYPVPFYGTSRAVIQNDPRADRPAISPKRVWGEVQTPVGLLSFGRMPSEWGLGILTTSGAGIDDDFGDTVDRIQFALPPVSTPLGRLVLVPIVDFDSEGVLYGDPHYAPYTGVGQPFDAESSDDARTYGVKVARLDTEDEIRRKVERNELSTSWGVYYNYRAQTYAYPQWNTDGFGGSYGPGQQPPATPTYGDTGTAVHRSAYAHIGDFWLRFVGARFRVEAEAALVYGQIGNAAASAGATATPEISLRQWGGTVVGEYKVKPNKLLLGAEVGAASGDGAPGFGNVPSRRPAPVAGGDPYPLAPYGSLEGPQWGGSDRSINNFRFNPAYRVDLVLWRHILGQVTDAFYVKPRIRWDILPGLAYDGAIVYSQALDSKSTPSAAADPATGALVKAGSSPLGVEIDTALRYGSGDGLQIWAEWGILQPLSGLESPGTKLSRAHFLQLGLAAKF